MILDKQRKSYDNSMDLAIKQTRAGYSKDQWERIVKAMEVMQTVIHTLILAGLIIIGLWVYAELSNQELHITGKDYCCYPCPNSTEWSVGIHPMRPIPELPPGNYISPLIPVLKPHVDDYGDAEYDEQQEQRVPEVNRTP